MTDPRLAFAKLANLTDKAVALLDEDARTDASIWLDCAMRPFQAKLTECEQIVAEHSDSHPHLRRAVDLRLVRLGSALINVLGFPAGPSIDDLARELVATVILLASVIAPEQAAIAARDLLPYDANVVDVPDLVREFLQTLGSDLRAISGSSLGSVRA